MITYFIFYDNLIYANQLSNAISKSNKNAQLSGLSTKISKSSIDNCNNILPHIIIATKSSHNKLSKMLNFNYYPVIITQNKALSTQTISNQVKKLTNDTKFSHKLNLYNFKSHTINTLKKFNFNISLSGTQYLLDCIMYTYENPYYNLNRINLKEFYMLIAKKYNISLNIVVWNIHTSISDMYKYTSRKFRLDTYGREYGITAIQIIKKFSNQH